MNYSLIMSCDISGVIDIDGAIPWINNPKYIDDLKNFRTITTKKIIIMGSKTFESLPNRGLLPNRTNIIITTRQNIIDEVVKQNGLTFSTVKHLHKYLCNVSDNSINEVFVIGGLATYKSMKHLISKIYLTVIPEISSSSVNSRITYFDEYKELIKDEISHNFSDNMNGMKYYVVSIVRPDSQYKNLISKILNCGNFIKAENDRTSFGYFATYGEMLKFDITNNKIPLTTLRGQTFRWIVEELLWFMKGQTDNKILKEKNITIWNKNTTADFIKKRKLSYNEDIAGPIYGFQWRRWGADYDAKGDVKGIDQLAKVIDDLKDPLTRYSRRHIISAWNVSDLDKMVLPPCHILYQFSVDSRDAIHTTFYQRSSDVALACSWNATSASILTHIIAKLTGLQSASVTMFIANAHIYANHTNIRYIENREPYDFPTIKLDIKDLDSLSGDQFAIIDYYSHPEISLVMNA